MKEAFSLRGKIKQFTAISIPIVITQLAMFFMSFFDIMMSGKYASNDLAGVAIGSSIWVPVFTGLSGILLSMSPIIAQLVGAKKDNDIAFHVMQGIYAGIAMAIFILIIGSIFLDPLLNRMELDHTVRQIAKKYLIAISFGIIPVFIYHVLRSFIDALGMTRTTMFITLISLPLNIFFNYIFIYGKFGFPELGGVGAGYASAITYWLVTAIAISFVHRKRPFQTYRIFHVFYSISLKKWKEIFMLGVPIGLSIFLETSIFSAITLLMSNFGTAVIASYQAAINFSSFLYMIPLSISMTLTIIVGFEVGANRPRDARSYSFLGIITAVSLSTTAGILLFLFREQVATIYSNDPEVIHLTGQFLLYVVFFQLSDAFLAPIQGTLRGYKDVNVTFLMALLSFWIIGLPLGFVLASYSSLGPFGYWIGLITGLAVGAITLSFRLLYVQKKKIAMIAGK